MIYAASPWAVLLSEHRPVACVPSGHSVRCDPSNIQRSETTLGAQTESLCSVAVGEPVSSHTSTFLDFARNHRSGAGRVCLNCRAVASPRRARLSDAVSVGIEL
jgi:hypothetical protein